MELCIHGENRDSFSFFMFLKVICSHGASGINRSTIYSGKTQLFISKTKSGIYVSANM